MSALSAAPPLPSRPLRRAVLWLAGLAPFFYVTYGAANWLAAARADVPSLVFAWERSIPFLPWTIVPYWTINAFYGLSLFLCRTREELDTHGRRLLAAQVVAVACFLAVPLRFSCEKPAVDGGVSGFLFAALAGFDKPFNQAPSLHIALLVILWDLYRRVTPGWLHPLLHAWSALIAVSVLTTWQHHFVDLPTGALLGLACLWAFPFGSESPFAGAALSGDPRRRALALRYGIGSAALGGLAVVLGGAGLWLFWPAVSLLLVAGAYALFGPEGFQKSADGRMSLAARLLLLPYIAGAFLNSRLWTRDAPLPVPLEGGVALGRIPGPREPPPAAGSLVDVAAELPPPRGWPVRALPMLDLVVPPPERLAAAADAVEAARASGPVLIACALGYSRSAAVAATWLLRSGRAKTVDEALAKVRRARPAVVVGPALACAIEEAARCP